MNDEALRRIRDGFDRRVKRVLDAERGRRLRRQKKRPPLAPGRGNYVRPYSYSIVHFAMRCLLLDEQIGAANAALIENARHYLTHPKDLSDRDSFHWHADVLTRLIEMFGEHGSVAAGRLSGQAEGLIMDTLWQYARRNTTIKEAAVGRDRTWRIRESENHHVQIFTTAWHFAKLAKGARRFAHRKYRDGTTAAEHHAAWTEYMKVYCLERAKKGMFIEVGNDGYNAVLLKGFYNVFDFAEDPELRRRVRCLLDVYWATWAELQLDGVRGGGRTRVAQLGGDRLPLSQTRMLGWFYFGLGPQPDQLWSGYLAGMTSAYRPPAVVADLACDVEGRGKYAVRGRLLGRVRRGYWEPPDYRMRTEEGGVCSYAWCTPGFIMGTLMVEPRRVEDWAAISSQNRWGGVIFAGHEEGRIVPQVQAADGGYALNTQWSVQSRGSLICQKLRTNTVDGAMRVWFSRAGLKKRVEEGGWVFVEAPGAYAAVRVVRGDVSWEASSDEVEGVWLRCADAWSPVILEVGCKGNFRDYGAFRRAVLKLRLSARDEVLRYAGLSGDRLTLDMKQRALPRVNGREVSFARGMAFDSPFVKGKWNSGRVTVAKDGRRCLFDFNGG
ncbi:MAG: hypothetical protein CMJ49_11345 [Planctomycetaceae bacterium]|nr:hypothetical protein [Planctomycetaceae bacterium]